MKFFGLHQITTPAGPVDTLFQSSMTVSLSGRHAASTARALSTLPKAFTREWARLNPASAPCGRITLVVTRPPPSLPFSPAGIDRDAAGVLRAGSEFCRQGEAHKGPRWRLGGVAASDKGGGHSVVCMSIRFPNLESRILNAPATALKLESSSNCPHFDPACVRSWRRTLRSGTRRRRSLWRPCAPPPGWDSGASSSGDPK
jgi:hypothetical protein